MAQASQNRIPDLSPDDELYGRRSEITSRAMATLLNNLDSSAKEQFGIELLRRDESGALQDGVRSFPTVRDLISFIETRLREGSAPSS